MLSATYSFSRVFVRERDCLEIASVTDFTAFVYCTLVTEAN